jgi:hypothetical protein
LTPLPGFLDPRFAGDAMLNRDLALPSDVDLIIVTPDEASQKIGASFAVR